MDFLKQKPVTAKSLSEKSSSILSVFSKTINELQTIINSAKDQIVVKDEEIRAAEIERDALITLVEKNEHVVSKLEDFVQ